MGANRTRRLTIARDDTVKLRGVKTRWRCRRADYCRWVVRTLTSYEGTYDSAREARAYLEALTDEDLMG